MINAYKSQKTSIYIPAWKASAQPAAIRRNPEKIILSSGFPDIIINKIRQKIKRREEKAIFLGE